MAVRWFVAAWELQPAYKDSRREGKEAEGKLWVGGSGPEVTPGDMRAGRLGEGAGDGKQRAGRASSVVVRGVGHARGVAHVGGAVEQDRVTFECLVLLGRADCKRSGNVHCWMGRLLGAEARVLPDLGCRLVPR